MADTRYSDINFQNSIVIWNSEPVAYDGNLVTYGYVYNKYVGE